MEERSLEGLEARSADGEVVGRIVEVVTDEESGEVTHVLVKGEDGHEVEVPISGLSLDPESDFATFRADRSDAEPGDHLGDEAAPEGYAPAESDVEDHRHEGQFATTPQDPGYAQPPEDLDREAAEAGGWEDEGTNPADSGYPRNDVYIDPETGEEEPDPLMEENETLQDEVEDLLVDTDLKVRSARDGVVELSGTAPSREDLDASVEEIMGLDGVREVDTTDVDVG